jgi:hypothetical protein
MSADIASVLQGRSEITVNTLNLDEIPDLFKDQDLVSHAFPTRKGKP